MGYQYMKEDMAALDEFPGLSQGDLDAVDRLFSKYLFFEKEKGGRRIWTSCCHREVFVGELQRVMGADESALLYARHNEDMECPFCHKLVRVKNRKLVRSEDTLREYHAVLFVHVSEDGETVWCQGYWSTKNYKGAPAGPPLFMVTRVYRFRRGEALQWERNDYRGRKVFPCSLHQSRVQEPMSWGGMCARNEAYRVIGFERLENSFLRYTWYDVPFDKGEDDLWRYCRKRRDLLRYLGVAARYPENVEMLRKAGLETPVWELVYKGKKNAAVMKWGERDPRAAFGLTKAELREFLDGKRNMSLLYIHKEVQKAGATITFKEAEHLDTYLGLNLVRDVMKRARAHGVPAGKLLKYLESFAGPRCHGVLVTHDFVAHVWIDYIDAAVQLGYDMSNPINQMPRDLDRRHDEATTAVRIKVEAALIAQAKKRFETLQKRYAFEDEHYFIRAPYDAEEIIAEGQALAHCVGGYAERHAKGTSTILFLRNKEWPAAPYVTIEMNGNKIVQIHGYGNDRGKGAVSPMITHKELLHNWRTWLKAGSKRNKNGEPYIPKPKTKKKEKVA